MKTILGIIVALIVAAMVWYVVSHSIMVNVTLPSTSQTTTQTNSNQEPVPATGPSTGSAQIANPASVNCVTTLHGTLEMKEEAGGTAGYCHLPDGRVCEEWSLFRGGCTAPPQQ